LNITRIRELFRKLVFWIKNSYWLKSGSYTLLSRLYRTFVGLIAFIILVRILPKSSFGEWILYLSIITVVEVIRDGFLINPLIKFVVEKSSLDKEEVPRVLTSSFVLNLIFSAFTFILILFLRSPTAELLNSEIIGTLLLIGGVKLMITLPGSFSHALQQANFEFKWVFWADVVNRTLFIIILMIIFVRGIDFGLMQLAWLDLGIYLISGIIGLVGARRLLNFSKVLSKQMLRQIFRFAKYTLATNVGSMFFRNVDSWMLSSILSPAAVAIYTPAIRVSNFVDVPFQSLNSILFPKIVQAFHEDGIGKVKLYYERSVSVTLSLLIPVNLLLWIFAEYVIIIVAGTDYLESVPILKITLLTSLIVPFVKQFGVVMDSIKRPQTNTKFMIFLVAMNVGFNYYFINNYGIIGAAYGTLCGISSGFIVSSIYLNRRMGVSINATLAQIFLNYDKALRKIRENLR